MSNIIANTATDDDDIIYAMDITIENETRRICLGCWHETNCSMFRRHDPTDLKSNLKETTEHDVNATIANIESKIHLIVDDPSVFRTDCECPKPEIWHYNCCKLVTFCPECGANETKSNKCGFCDSNLDFSLARFAMGLPGTSDEDILEDIVDTYAKILKYEDSDEAFKTLFGAASKPKKLSKTTHHTTEHGTMMENNSVELSNPPMTLGCRGDGECICIIDDVNIILSRPNVYPLPPNIYQSIGSCDCGKTFIE